MSAAPRLYFDNAATSFPKPPGVVDAVSYALRELGAPLGRGSSRAAAEVAAVIDDLRRALARQFGVVASEVCFTNSGTDSLNTAISGLLRPGDRVVTTCAEHNSVLRPLRDCELRGVHVDRVAVDPAGRVDAAEMARVIGTGHRPRLVVATHASNVTGVIQPIAEIGAAARQAGALFLLDAAQTAGHLPIDLRQLPVDLLAAPGHKGLLGPLGTGVLVIRAEIASDCRPLRLGGTGTHSESDVQPDSIPDKFEAGNLNVPGLFGLAAAVRWAAGRSAAERACESERLGQLVAGLNGIPGVTRFGPNAVHDQVGVVSFNVDSLDPREAALVFETHFGIECRAGFHCAPLIHTALGTAARGGTLRLSPGPFTTAAEIDAVLSAVRQVATS